MKDEEFKKKLNEETRKLSKMQTTDFAWRCAVRALPFLAINGNFNFWDEQNRKNHIYSIFYALDISVSSVAANTAYDAANAANAAAHDVVHFVDYNAANDATYVVAYAVANAANVAANTANTADFAAANAAYAAANAANHTTNAANIADLVIGKASDYAPKRIKIESIILQDLKYLQGGKEQFTSIEWYGVIWYNFQKALEAEGCAYWGKLYKNIFDNQFIMDKEALKRRLSVPKEIQAQGAAAVASYLEEIEKKGAEQLNEARIIILGDKGSGKTCIARRLVNPNAPMTKENESTPGVETTFWKLEKDNINVRIWDFAGHVVTHAVHQFFLSERCLYIIVYNGRTDNQNQNGNELQYWLDHMKNYGGDSKAIILVNKRDQHRVEIPINFLKEQYPIINHYTFSIKKDKKELETFRTDVAQYIKNNLSWENQIIPKSYFEVKERLEELFKGINRESTDFITKEKFIKIAENIDKSKQDELLKDLHFLGVGLWYENMEDYNTLVLNPEWISHGVYKIINWVHNEKQHSLGLADFEQVFKNEANRYPKDKHEFLYKLMIHYELAYETDGKDCLIIPHLLKEDRPENLPDFPVGESLMLRYKADQPLPPNTISRFIVRHNHEIKKEKSCYCVWRYGVVLEDSKGTTALVREEDRTINVSVKGKNKTNYISTLRDTLNDIFKSYKSKIPDLQYRIVRFGEIPKEIEKENPLWLSEKNIFYHFLRRTPFYDAVTGQYIDLKSIIDKLEINIKNLTLGSGDIIDNSIHNTFNFQNCNINLQSNLNELARLFKKTGNLEEAEELEYTAEVLDEAKQLQKDEIKKKGVFNNVRRFLEDLGDDKSKLHKTVKGLKRGISIAQDIAKTYNDIAQWAGLPQVPKPFLKKEDK